jgi:iron complex transport system substrate-binding protein
VLLVVGVAPIIVAGPESFADELVRRAGATNSVVEGSPWHAIDVERVAELDPDVILDAGSGGGTRITAGTPGWRSLRAVREGHVLRLGDDRVLRAGPRVGEGLAVLARLLHPGLTIP